jgi:heat shock protein HslJ
MKYLVIAAVLVLLSCQNAGSKNAGRVDTAAIAVGDSPVAGSKANDTTTLAGTWHLQAVLPSDTAAGKTPWLYLNLETTRFSGNSGCNSMHGKFYFSKTDSSFAFGNKIAIARMLCAGYNEGGFLKSLKNTTRYKLKNGVLTFVGDDKTELSHWVRREEKPAKTLRT